MRAYQVSANQSEPRKMQWSVPRMAPPAISESQRDLAIFHNQIYKYLSDKQFDKAVDFALARKNKLIELGITDEQINKIINEIKILKLLDPSVTLSKEGKFEQAIAFAESKRHEIPESSRELLDNSIGNIKKAELTRQIGKFIKNNQFVDAINFVKSNPDKFKDAGYSQHETNIILRILRLHEFDYQVQIRAKNNIDDAISYVEAKRNHLEELGLKKGEIEDIIIELKNKK